MTRPDLSFSVNVLSSEVVRGTIATTKAVNKIVKKAKMHKSKLRFSKLGKLSDLSVKVFPTDLCGKMFPTHLSGRVFPHWILGIHMYNGSIEYFQLHKLCFFQFYH